MVALAAWKADSWLWEHEPGGNAAGIPREVNKVTQCGEGIFFLGANCEEREKDRLLHGGKMFFFLTQKKRFHSEGDETREEDAEGGGGLRSGLEFPSVGSKLHG